VATAPILNQRVNPLMKSKLVYLVAVLCVACGPDHPRVGNNTAANANDVRSPAAAVAQQVGGVCPTPAGGLRIGLDTVAGMPANLTIASLRELCSSARVDTLYYAGFSTQALRFDFRGGTIWAVQNIPDTDTLIASQSISSWEAVGDSLRFPDGRLIPRRLGQLRAADSVGYMFINSGDDTEGADVSLCSAPGLGFTFDTLPAPADTSIRPFAGISVTDTLNYKRVDQQRDTIVLKNMRRWCPRVTEKSAR